MLCKKDGVTAGGGALDQNGEVPFKRDSRSIHNGISALGVPVSLGASGPFAARSSGGNARGSAASGTAGRPVVVVDMREFMSNLPLVLHSMGFHVKPVTLEVADYVLSPTVCVERKSLSDLRQSFASGRLYKQCASMAKCYRTPVLLVEFSSQGPFFLAESTDLGDDVSVNSILSKVALLVMHFRPALGSAPARLPPQRALAHPLRLHGCRALEPSASRPDLVSHSRLSPFPVLSHDRGRFFSAARCLGGRLSCARSECKNLARSCIAIQ